MILRRVITHVRKQEWTAIGIDLVIVVVGVFIGIQVANWNEARRDRADEGAVLKSLHEEVSAAKTLSARILADRLDVLDRLAESADRLYGAGTVELGAGHCIAIASSNDLYVGFADLPSFSQLLSSGRVAIIRDHALLDALSGLTQARAALEFALKSFDTALVNLSQTHAQAIRLVPREIPVATSPSDRERDYGAECDIDALAGDPEFRNALITNLEYFDAFARDGLRPWVHKLEEVHNRLDAILAIRHDGAMP